MCPLCLSTAALLSLGGGSAASLAAIFAALKLKGHDHGNRDGDASDRDA